MPRRRRAEEHENHERWLVSYADFITLLFAFFVVMYSISSVNEGKYRVLSNSLLSAFQNPATSTKPVTDGDIIRAGKDSILDGSDSLLPLEWSGGGPNTELPDLADITADPEQKLGGDGEQASMGEVTAEVERTMSTYIDDELVDVTRGDSWVEVTVKSSLLFGSGSSRISRDALKPLRDIANILKHLPNPVRVEGFTDNVPIGNRAFPSNWELSAARAASVVHLFTRYGVDPKRLAATGYGEYRPVADNSTAEGRNKNRRVAIVILGGQDERTIVQQRELELRTSQSGGVQ